jgi:hypothetical protein
MDEVAEIALNSRSPDADDAGPAVKQLYSEISRRTGGNMTPGERTQRAGKASNGRRQKRKDSNGRQ